MKPIHLRAVDPQGLPDYPEALCDPSLTSDYFTKFWHDRWLSSRMHLSASMAVQGMALNLFFLARKQVPVGSLPADPLLLARLLRVTDTEWERACSEAITPLHHWTQYRVGDEVVLGHPVVVEVALDAMDRREARKASNEERAVRERRRRLVPQLREVGCGDALCRDERLIEWLDTWLLDNHRGQRRAPQIHFALERGLAAANKAGLLNRPALKTNG
jgi:hypothetical protein